MANKIEEFKAKFDKELNDDTKPWTKFLKLAEAKTNVPKLYIAAGGILLIVLYLAFGYAAQILAHIIAVAYPAYISMKAVESKDTKDDTKWLTYWVVYAVLTIIEFFSYYITKIIPFYWLIKCVFHIWLMADTEYNGSIIIYQKVIRPYFLKSEGQIDDLLDKVTKSAGDAIRKGTEEVLKKGN